MVEAYVLLTIASGQVESVIKAMSGVSEVKRVDPIAGPFDAIALVEAENFDAVGKLIVDKVQKIDGVTRTLTCFIAKL